VHSCARFPRASREKRTIGYRNRGPSLVPPLGRPGAGGGSRGNPNDARQVKAGKVATAEHTGQPCISVRYQRLLDKRQGTTDTELDNHLTHVKAPTRGKGFGSHLNCSQEKPSPYCLAFRCPPFDQHLESQNGMRARFDKATDRIRGTG